MTTFAKEKYEHGVPDTEVIHEVFELIKNDKSLFKEFIDNIPKSLESEKRQLITNLLRVVRGTENMLPPKKYKQLKRPKKDKYVDYELKTNNLRLYFFREDNNRILVLGGFKKDESKNLSKFRLIKNNYFESCIQKKN